MQVLQTIRVLTPPPPPTRIESGATYARSPSLEPPTSGKRYAPLSRVLITIGSYKSTPFPGFLGKSSRDKWPKMPPPPSRENGNTNAAPLYIRVCVCGGVGGGGGGSTHWSSWQYDPLRNVHHEYFFMIYPCVLVTLLKPLNDGQRSIIIFLDPRSWVITPCSTL